LGLLIVLIVIFSLLTKNFFTLTNFTTIQFTLPIQGIIAVLMTLLIISGNIDLSVGANISFSGCLLATLLMDVKLNEYLSIALVLVAGILIGLINAFFVAKLKIHPIIVTMGTLFAFKGIAYVIVGQGSFQSKAINIGLSQKHFDLYSFIGRGKVGIIPFSMIIFIVVFIIFWIILNKTTFGKQVFVIGGNVNAARFSGINVDKVVIILYVLIGFFSAISGLIMASRLAGGLPNSGDGYELGIITAVLLGGASLFGGRGSLIGAGIAVILLEVVRQGINLMHVNTFWQYFLTGVLLLIAVLLDRLKSIRFA